ncbi:MAG: type IV toxin-antitoxin system AbiEi family antitoxin domain-containing protein [Chloroflexi bacterium]|nr:type IV toxin-antitoxin system AbiEi family antitoxin domain-containing protein [Chloroflexota bacterium]
MPNTTSTLGSQEHLFLASLAGKDRRVFRFRDALPYWASVHQTRKAISRLSKKGWIKRLERGLYLLVPLEAGPEGQWSDDPLVIGTQLVSEGAIAYWTALHFWNMTEQVPRTVFVQTVSRRSSSQEDILGVRYQFVTIKPNRFFGIQTQSSNGMSFGITDREKTLVDACDRPELCGGILQIAQVLQAINILDWEKLDAYLDRFDSGAVYKRLGYLIERLGTPMPDREIRLAKWKEKLTQGIAWLEPGGAQTGPVVTRWRIRVNTKTLEGTNDL